MVPVVVKHSGFHWYFTFRFLVCLQQSHSIAMLICEVTAFVLNLCPQWKCQSVFFCKTSQLHEIKQMYSYFSVTNLFFNAQAKWFWFQPNVYQLYIRCINVQCVQVRNSFTFEVCAFSCVGHAVLIILNKTIDPEYSFNINSGQTTYEKKKHYKIYFYFVFLVSYRTINIGHNVAYLDVKYKSKSKYI